MSQRVFFVGTDTAVGKTAVVAALLRSARDRGVVAVPFKPAQSGDDQPSDVERLLAAAGLPASLQDRACPLRFAAPLAPGLAEDRSAFIGSTASRAGSRGGAEDASVVPPRVVERLEAWERQHTPALTLIEGAGGLHVPMPGGGWQPAWIVALAPWTVVVGRAGLGTINHCLATIEGLRAIGRPALGFVLSRAQPQADLSEADNPAVIEAASGIPYLGTLAHGPEPALEPRLLEALLERLGPGRADRVDRG